MRLNLYKLHNQVISHLLYGVALLQVLGFNVDFIMNDFVKHVCICLNLAKIYLLVSAFKEL
jgi:hypothetical protein